MVMDMSFYRIVFVVLLSQVHVTDGRARHAYSKTQIDRSGKPPDGKIFGGRMAQPGQFPFQVAVVEDDRFICGGSILNPWTILTAAHCIDQQDPAPERYSIEAGKTSWYFPQSTLQERKVNLVFVHEAYDSTWITDDVAILHLETPLIFNRRVNATQLSDSTFDRQSLNRKCVASGWGSVNKATRPPPAVSQTLDILLWADPHPGGECSKRLVLYAGSSAVDGPYPGGQCSIDDWGYTPGVLLWVDLTLVANYRCNRKLRRRGYSTIPRTNICTIDPGEGTCSGDSGGPMGCYDADGTYRQIGITSWGPENCRKPPNVFARVSAYRPWIEAHTFEDWDYFPSSGAMTSTMMLPFF